MKLDKIKFFVKFLRRCPEFNYKEVKTINLSSDEKSDGDLIPKIIWMYWHEEKLPPFVDLCINLIRTLHPDYKINILNEHNYNSFISLQVELSDFSERKAQFADVLRLSLLLKYGGYWIDASILFLERFDSVFSQLGYVPTKPILFYVDVFNNEQISTNTMIENWFIGASANNKFIRLWLNELLSSFSTNDPVSYFTNKEGGHNLVRNIPNPDYLVAYIAAQYVLSKEKFDLFLIRSDDLGHKFFYNTPPYIFDVKYVADLLTIYAAPKNPMPLIKIVGASRDILDHVILEGNINKRSIIGQLMK